MVWVSMPIPGVSILKFTDDGPIEVHWHFKTELATSS